MNNACLLKHQTMLRYEFRQKEKSFKDTVHAWLVLEKHPSMLEQPNFTCFSLQTHHEYFRRSPKNVCTLQSCWLLPPCLKEVEHCVKYQLQTNQVNLQNIRRNCPFTVNFRTRKLGRKTCILHSGSCWTVKYKFQWPKGK